MAWEVIFNGISAKTPLNTYTVSIILQSRGNNHLVASPCNLSHLGVSNSRPTRYECVALPAELRWLFFNYAAKVKIYSIKPKIFTGKHKKQVRSV